MRIRDGVGSFKNDKVEDNNDTEYLPSTRTENRHNEKSANRTSLITLLVPVINISRIYYNIMS